MDRPIRVELFKGSVCVRGVRVALGPKQLEVLSVLIVRKRPLQTQEIVDAVWPEAEFEAASGTLKVLICRLRRLAGDLEFIVRTNAGYALGTAVATDLGELERLAEGTRTLGALPPNDLADLRSAFAALTESAWRPMPELLGNRARALVVQIGERLGASALRSGNPSEALALADHLTTLDPCDESGWELAIRAHVARSDRNAAIRAYREYARTLATELGIAPSPHLIGFISDSQTRAVSVA